MSIRARILVVAATDRELVKPDGWPALICGVGPVDAAAATAAAIALHKPSAILHVGIAGARRSAALAPGSLVIGASSHYCDLSVPAHFAPHIVVAPPALVAAASHVLPDAPHLVIGTSGHIGGTTPDCPVEAMEGFGVLRAAQLAGIQAIEVRAISNEVEERDHAHWHFDKAFAAIGEVTARLVDEIARCVS
jgi:futalosine hydrolase